MSIPLRLSDYLDGHGARYDVRMHEHTGSSAETARSANIPANLLAKSVVLEDEAGYVLAVVPADRSVRIGRVAHLLGRKDLRLSDEDRLSSVFADCERGAVPPIGMAWGIETVVDEQLEAGEIVYLEAGDHEQLLRMSRDQFREIMGSAQHASICRTKRRRLGSL